MNDLKADMFLNELSFWEESIQKGIEKGMPLNVLNTFIYPEAREIVLEKISSGEYKIEPPRIAYINKETDQFITYEQAKTTKKVRELCINAPMDRLVLSVIYRIFYKLYISKIHPNCVSYQKGISVSKIAKKLSHKLIQYSGCKEYIGCKIDISKYFDSVGREALLNMLNELSTDSIIDKLIYEYYTDDRVVVDGEVIERYKSLAQGCALAAFLANYALRKIDEELSKLNIVYYRYSDDIIMLGEDWKIGFELLKKRLSELSLSINPSKVEYLESDKWFTFLGYSYRNGDVTFSKKKLKRIEHEVKIRTISIAREKRKGVSKDELKNMIRSIQKYFFYAYKEYNYSSSIFSAVNVVHDINEIENYIKDCLRAAYTGETHIYGLGYVNDKNIPYAVTHGVGRNVGANFKKTKNDTFKKGDLLAECGWVSLNHMYKVYRYEKALNNQEINNIKNFIPMPKITRKIKG